MFDFLDAIASGFKSVPVIGDIASAWEGNRQAEQAHDWDVQEAQRGREWSAAEAEKAFNREMSASNTSYQRAAQDMRAAGINPLLLTARSGGASTPSSSAPSSGIAQPGHHIIEAARTAQTAGINSASTMESLSKIVQNLSNVFTQKQERVESQQRITESQARTKETLALLTPRVNEIGQRIQLMEAQDADAMSSAILKDASTAQIQEAIREIQARIPTYKAHTAEMWATVKSLQQGVQTSKAEEAKLLADAGVSTLEVSHSALDLAEKSATYDAKIAAKNKEHQFEAGTGGSIRRWGQAIAAPIGDVLQAVLIAQMARRGILVDSYPNTSKRLRSRDMYSTGGDE